MDGHGPPPLDVSAGRGRCVVLVDDDPLGRKLAAIELSLAGFTVTMASSAEEALVAVRHRRPDAIVTDINLTGMDGFEFCQELRKDAASARIPVILTSSAIEPHDSHRSHALGVPCVARTSDLGDVIALLERLLGASGSGPGSSPAQAGGSGRQAR